MLKIPEELRQDYMRDSVPKQLYIQTEEDAPTKLTDINWYIGQYNEYEYETTPEYTTSINKEASGEHTLLNLVTPDTVYQDYLPFSEYIYISFQIKLTNVTTLPTSIGLAVSGKKTTAFQLEEYQTEMEANTWIRLYCCIKNPNVIQSLDFLYLDIIGACKCTATIIGVQIQSTEEFYETLGPHDYYDGPIPYVIGGSVLRSPEGIDVEELIHIHQPDIAVVTNEDLDAEAFSMTELMSSADNLKFGACESSYVEFTVVNRNNNWKDRYVRPYITTRDEPFNISDINLYNGKGNRAPDQSLSYSYTNSYLSWSMSTQEHDLSPNLDTNLLKLKPIIAVKMKVKMAISNYTTTPVKVRFYLDVFYGNSQSGNIGWPGYYEFNVSDVTSDWVTLYDWIPMVQVEETTLYFPNLYEISKLRYRFVDANGNTYPSSAGTLDYTVQMKDIQFCLCDEVYWDDFKEWDIMDCIGYEGISLDEYIISKTGNIPLGRYKVTDIQEDYTHAFRRLDITAYDELVKLDENAADWYTMYMYLVLCNEDVSMTNKAKYAYVRQIFSSFWSIMKRVGLLSREVYTETLITSWGYNGLLTDWDFQVYNPSSGTAGSSYKLVYGYFTANVGGYTNKVFCIDAKSREIETHSGYDYYSECNDYRLKVDDQYRGIVNAQVCVEESLSGGATKRYCVDFGDYFKVSDNCTSITVHIIKGFISRSAQQIDSNISNYTLDTDFGIKFYNVDWAFDLENASARLTYFNWGTLDIFACESSITARDVVKSLLEVTGCFLALDRYGKVQFRYITKSALYPRDDLYPANNLYPRGNAAVTLFMNNYEYARCKPYKVQSIGRIQIVKQIRDNKARSVCEWEYIGDPTSKQAYLIDDNIFYCNDAMEYDWDNMPDIAELLEKMYTRISNISYTPNETSARGLPWVETGDVLGVVTQNGGFESFICRRTMKGIHGLHDLYEAEGDQYIKPINNYAYKAYIH